MMTPMRYIVLVLTILVSLHFLMTISREEYGRAAVLAHLSSQFRSSKSSPSPLPQTEGVTLHPPLAPAGERKANATFIILARNDDLGGVLASMRQLEDRFNNRFNYPYVFLNEQLFTTKFKSRVQALTNAKVEFGLIPKQEWKQPHWINETRASHARVEMTKNKVIYGWSISYRNMCRYNSGFFYRHPLLDKYKYYWRIEPDVHFYCDMDFDPFLYMQDYNKVYGFTVALYEYPETIPTLWNTVKEFARANPSMIPRENMLQFISDDDGETFNFCHFWSNFEIASLDFWRSEQYSKFFDHLDKSGGFYYERWGDAPIHSIAAALFAKKEQIHFFNEIGYSHSPLKHCPQGEAHARGKCWCDPQESFDYDIYSCLRRYDDLFV